VAQAQEVLAVAHEQQRTDLRAIAGRAQSTSVLASQRAREVRGPFAALFPHGLRPGTSVAVRAARPSLESAAMRNAITLAAGVVPTDGWVAAVGVPSLGVLAAAEAGLALERLVFFAAPAAVWGTIAVAAVDAFDVVVLSVPARPRAAEVRRLAGRTRERGNTIVAIGPGVTAWGGDARLVTSAVTWEGLGDGHGTLQSCRVSIELDGRGSVRPRQMDLVL
jgi:hypothetical protein